MWAGVGKKEAPANAISLANSRKRHDLTLENVLYLVRETETARPCAGLQSKTDLSLVEI